MSRVLPVLLVLLAGLLAAPALPVAAAEQKAAAPDGRPYLGDPAAEAALVGQEEARLVAVRRVMSSAAWNGIDVSRPYRLDTGRVNTLVLVPRGQPYTLQELAASVPDSVTRSGLRSYLVREHIAVQEGATLALRQQGGLTARLLSTNDGFASIVVLGGTLATHGTPMSPVNIGSFDPVRRFADMDTTDGRAYVRVLGGHAAMIETALDDLGFWSGNTGGLALTGSDPSARAAATGDSGEEEGTVPVLAIPPEEASGDVVTARLRGVRIDGNAYGIFVTGAEGVSIDDVVVERSLVDGIVLHRHVSGTTISDTSSIENAMNGFTVSSSSSLNRLTRVSAVGNARDGLSLDGRPLADGPNAVGIPVASYGRNTVVDGVFADNARYGVEILGGSGISVRSSAVRGNQMGIVLSAAAGNVVIVGNEVTGQVRHGIAVRDDVSGARLEGNTVSGGQTGIYVRNAAAEVSDNRVEGVTRHGITVVGASQDTSVSGNVVHGTGPTPIDVDRAIGALVERNEVDGWVASRSLAAVLEGVFQPLTLIWVAMIALVVLSIVVRTRARRDGIRHPYAAQAPLGSYSQGIVDRASVGRVRS